MKLYRVLKPLQGKKGVIQPGEPTALYWVDETGIKALEHRGAVSEIHAPPLTELPLPKAALTKMKKAGMKDVADLLTGTDLEAAELLKVNKDRAAKWRREIAQLLMVRLPQQG